MRKADAAQRSTIRPSRQRQIRRVRNRTPLCGLSRAWGDGNGGGDSVENQPRVWEIDRVAADGGRPEVNSRREMRRPFGRQHARASRTVSPGCSPASPALSLPPEERNLRVVPVWPDIGQIGSARRVRELRIQSTLQPQPIEGLRK
jgi:hypothetical protein